MARRFCYGWVYLDFLKSRSYRLMQIFAHVGPEDPFALHHILPMLAAAGSGLAAYVYLFGVKILDWIRSVKKKLFRSRR